MENADIIRATLGQLLRQPEDDLAFVVFEDRDSGKFVQFTGSVSSALVLDLPAQALSEGEFYRAVAFFRQRGVAVEEYELLDAPGGRPVAEQFTFQMTFRSVDAAVSVVLLVIDEIYQLQGKWSLSVKTSWLA